MFLRLSQKVIRSHAVLATGHHNMALESFVTKETAIFRGMPLGKRRLFILIMAFQAELFRFLFPLDVMKTVMDFIMGKGRGGFFRCIEKKNKDSRENKDKQAIAEKQFTTLLMFH
jgi:hypothetical protein